MPLLALTLENEIRAITDKEYSDFTEFPEDIMESADRFSQAMDTYAQEIVTRPSSTGTAAVAAFYSEWVLMASSTEASYISNRIHFKTAWSKYAIAFAPGMVTGDWISTPPAGLPALDHIFESSFYEDKTAQQIANEIAKVVDPWMKTGTVTNTLTGVTLPWT